MTAKVPAFAGKAMLVVFLLTGCVSTGPKNYAPYASKVLVLKNERKMYLLDEYGQFYREYPIGLGGNPVGPKQCEGDERTPEGIYTIDASNPDSKYHLSLRISYPNDLDKERAESQGLSPGGDIFIHGVPNHAGPLEGFFYRFNPTWTDGCIAVSNLHMEEIWGLVGEGTPIEIRP